MTKTIENFNAVSPVKIDISEETYQALKMAHGLSDDQIDQDLLRVAIDQIRNSK